MNKREQLDGGVVYIVDDYSMRQDVVNDLEKGERVVIISKESDVLSFYGLLLERNGQYNVYKVDDYDEVDEDYLFEVSNRDNSKEEAIVYVGKPMSQLATEVIDSLNLSGKELRVMEMVKEVLRGSEDIKEKATVNLLNEKLAKEKAVREAYENELKEYKKNDQDRMKSTEFVTSTINLNNLGVNIKTKVMYIREYSEIPYLHTCLKVYKKWLELTYNKRVKLVMFDNKLFEMKYKTFIKLKTQNDYLANPSYYLSSNDNLCCFQVFPKVVTDLYKEGYDVLIIIDRIMNPLPMVSGKNVRTFKTSANLEILEWLTKLPQQDFTYICTNELNYDNCIIINKLKKEISLNTENEKLYIYPKIPNSGKDKRKIYEIFNEILGV